MTAPTIINATSLDTSAGTHTRPLAELLDRLARNGVTDIALTGDFILGGAGRSSILIPRGIRRIVGFDCKVTLAAMSAAVCYVFHARNHPDLTLETIDFDGNRSGQITTTEKQCLLMGENSFVTCYDLIGRNAGTFLRTNGSEPPTKERPVVSRLRVIDCMAEDCAHGAINGSGYAIALDVSEYVGTSASVRVESERAGPAWVDLRNSTIVANCELTAKPSPIDGIQPTSITLRDVDISGELKITVPRDGQVSIRETAAAKKCRVAWGTMQPLDFASIGHEQHIELRSGTYDVKAN